MPAHRHEPADADVAVTRDVVPERLPARVQILEDVPDVGPGLDADRLLSLVGLDPQDAGEVPGADDVAVLDADGLRGGVHRAVDPHLEVVAVEEGRDAERV